MRPVRRAAVALAGLAALTAPATLGAQTTAPADRAPAPTPGPSPSDVRAQALDAAAAWRDTLGATRAPPLPTPGDPRPSRRAPLSMAAPAASSIV